jgi:hypothetical protein
MAKYINSKECFGMVNGTLRRKTREEKMNAIL